MNSIKNAIVTVTLLAVGYGAYQVLKNPSQDDFDTFTAQQQLVASTSESASVSAEALQAPEIQVDPPMVDTAQLESPARFASETSTESTNLAAEQPFVPPPLYPSGDRADAEAAADYVPLPASQSSLLASESSADLADTFVDPAVTEQAGTFDAPVLNAAPTPPASMLDRNALGASDTATSQADALPVDNSLGPIPAAGENSTFEQVWQAAQQQISDADPAQALATLSPWNNDPSLSDQQLSRCHGLLDRLAGTVIYSRGHFLEAEYIVQPGETLEEIATRYSVPQELLAKINGIALPYALGTGESLKVVRGPFRAEVHLQRNELVLYLGTNYAGRFPVAIGQDLPLQEAFYRVAEKSPGRNYFDRRSGQEVLKGAANNRYGDYWIGLRGEQITSGHSVGIHGRPSNPSPNDIGSISLDARDAEDVFSILSIGSRVQISR